MRISFTLFKLILFVFVGLAYAQSPVNEEVTAEQRQEADAFFQKQDWENASKSYEKIVKTTIRNFLKSSVCS